MTASKPRMVALTLMVLGMGLMVWYATQEGTVAADGTLTEPFGAWAAGIGLFLAGTATYLADWLIRSLRNRRQR